MAHRPAALRHVNKVLVLQNGRATAFGDRDAVLGEMLQPNAAAAAAAMPRPAAAKPEQVTP
jgi:ABC-type protease/lipase transport system fused ATPase/permease subunit